MVTKNDVITDRIVTLVTDSDNRPKIHMDGYTGHSSHDCEFFPSMIFCGEAAKKASIDGLKW